MVGVSSPCVPAIGLVVGLVLLVLVTGGPGGFPLPVLPNSCKGPVQENLRFGCSQARSLALDICCHNSDFAEPPGFFDSVGAPGGLFAQLNRSGTTTFYDPVCGKPLFRAPVGRPFSDWRAESEEHGWPSFRQQELVRANVVFLPGGEMRSTCGTHLGHNIPDGEGDRYCIDLVCIAGRPAPSLPGGRASLWESAATARRGLSAGGGWGMACAVAVCGVVASLGGLVLAMQRRRPAALAVPLVEDADA
mmetsp:Transcript_56685/g.168727  ORF Transcript_56685/g.168727 Transcript_56685/m.168727 type:complete len:248 (+) Transcript_56685:59-802(+)